MMTMMMMMMMMMISDINNDHHDNDDTNKNLNQSKMPIALVPVFCSQGQHPLHVASLVAYEYSRFFLSKLFASGNVLILSLRN